MTVRGDIACRLQGDIQVEAIQWKGTRKSVILRMPEGDLVELEPKDICTITLRGLFMSSAGPVSPVTHVEWDAQ